MSRPYNYFRDYDPKIGRYVQSDSIGLLGGFNTFGYVSGRPLSLIDPLGLCEVAVWSGGYIAGWKPCEPEPAPPLPGMSGGRPRQPWPGHIEIPTSIPKDPICYPEREPPDDWRPRDNACFLECMATGISLTALGDAGVEAGGHGLGKAAGAFGLGAVKKGLGKAVPGYSLYSLQKGIRGANRVCNIFCR
ncbi:RHS repeat-associated core domain-containing protein [Usitatibacter palustris]|uniref:RHS repeat-associated core domain-containing protein n=1 Tax=Usitatibacter palustris TaxID=2732487 RepID=UPI001487D158